MIPPTAPSPIRIAFDIGGVLSKYPEYLLSLVFALYCAPGFEVYILTDMHPYEKTRAMLDANGYSLIPRDRILLADYDRYGEGCKAAACSDAGIHVLVDDFIGYVAAPGAPPVRLLVMPDASRPYYSDDWKTPGDEPEFGRRRFPAGAKRPPEARRGNPPQGNACVSLEAQEQMTLELFPSEQETPPSP